MQLHTLHHIHGGAAAINAVYVCVIVRVCVHTHIYSAMLDLQA